MIVCADDFGLADDINEAVLDLARRGRLSAVSCMVALEQFRRADLLELTSVKPALDLGLHVILTDIHPLRPVADRTGLLQRGGTFHSFGGLLRRSLLRQVNPEAVAYEVKAQYTRFLEMAGQPPDFVDGHLHVHQFPCVRKGVIRFLEQTDAEGRPYVRNNAMPVAKILNQRVSVLKCFAVSRFGAAFQRAARGAGLRTNRGFAGVYDYRSHAAYPEYLSRFVACMEDERGILMAHPGSREPWRRAEFETLRDTVLLAGRLNRFAD